MSATDVDAMQLIDLQLNLLEQIQSGYITPAQLEWFVDLTREQRDALTLGEEAPAEVIEPEVRTGILRCISEGTEIVIDATDGKRTISEAKKVFPVYVEFGFNQLRKACGARGATPAKVYQLVQDATFVQMFESLGVGKKSLCFTQDQIITYCENYLGWLNTDGYSTFFLFEEEGKFLIAGVFVSNLQLGVRHYWLDHDNAWKGDHRLRLVVPQV